MHFGILCCHASRVSGLLQANSQKSAGIGNQRVKALNQTA